MMIQRITLPVRRAVSRCLLLAWMAGPLAAGAAGTGLTTTYFDNADFTTPKLTNVSATVDFNWGTSAPAAGVGADTFSVRWTGQLEPTCSETCTFYVTADDGARLWVDNQLIAARPASFPNTAEFSGQIALQAGHRVNLMIEFVEQTGNAGVRLEWSSPSQPRQVIPQSQLYAVPLVTSDAGTILEEYWMGLTGTNLTTLTNQATYPNRPFGRELLTSFESLQPFWTNNCGSRVWGQFIAPASGSYQFAVAAADAAQLFLGTNSSAASRQLLASVPLATGFRQFSNFASQVSVPLTLTQGQAYFIELLVKTGTNGAHFSVGYKPPGAATFAVMPGDCLAPAKLHTPQPALANLFDTLATGHPRINLSPQRIAWLKSSSASNSPVQFVAAWNSVSNSAASLLTTPLSTNAWRVVDIKDIGALALTYLVTGNTNFAERAWLQLSNGCTNPDWYNTQFLDTGDMNFAYALGYDWLYDYYTPARRQQLLTNIVSKGITATWNSRGSWWAQTTANNWNFVCVGGAIMASLAVGLDAEAEAERFIDFGLPRMKAVLGHNTTDQGAYYEGVQYWLYGMQHAIQTLASLTHSLGHCATLDDTPGLDDAGLFYVHAVGPANYAFDYSDAYNSQRSGFGQFWLARRFNRPTAAWHVRSRMNTSGNPFFETIWYDSRGVSPAAAGVPADNYFRGPTATTSSVFDPVEVVTLRTRRDTAEAAHFAFKCGKVNDSHGHLDIGTFVFDALGKRWAWDSGIEDYDYPGWFDGTQRWWFYRARAEGHNTLVLNPGPGPDQALGGKASILAYESDPAGDHSLVLGDLTPAYTNATRAWRGLKLFNRRFQALIQDEIQTPAPATLWWFFHLNAANTVTFAPDHRSVTLTDGTDRLWVKLLSPDGTFSLLNAESFPTTPTPTGGQSTNANRRKLALQLTGITNTTIAVWLVPLLPGDVPPADAPALTALNTWAFAPEPTNAPPAAEDGNVVSTPGGFVEVDLAALASDSTTSPTNLLFRVNAATNGSVSLLGDGHTARFIAPANFTKAGTFGYTATDRWADPRLVFHYDFEDPWPATNAIRDASGRLRDGVLEKFGTGTYAVSNLFPPAFTNDSRRSLRLAASGNHTARLSRNVSPAELDLNSDSWTLSLWFRRQNLAHGDWIFYLGSDNGWTGSGDELYLWLGGNGRKLLLDHVNDANAYDLNLASGDLVNAGEWHHAAITFAATAPNTGTVRLYLDGALTGAQTNFTWKLKQEFPLHFGGVHSTSSDRYLDGCLDDIALFAGALTPAEIAALAAQPVLRLAAATRAGTVTIQPVAVNHPPVAPSPGNRQVIAGTALSVTNGAYDPDLPPQRLWFRLLSAPPGAQLDPNTGTLTWRPAISTAPSTNQFVVVVTEAGWETNLAPLADAYVRDGAFSNLNFGTDPTLQVKRFAASGQSRESLVRFAVPADFTPFSSARLRLMARSVSLPGMQAVAAVTNDAWSESTLTWSNAPLSGPALDTWTPVAGGAAESDVTLSALAAQAGDGLLSLRLFATNATADGLVTYHSREGSSSDGPRLTLTRPATDSLSVTQTFQIIVTLPVRSRLVLARALGGGPELTIHGDPGPDYTIQSTTNLADGLSWQNWFSTNAPPQPWRWSDSDTNFWPQRFYRVLPGP